jgi:hypothetical protein
MEQTKHTAENWHIIPKGKPFAGDIANERGEVVAQAYGTSHNDKARLIAAAPDLLAALKAVWNSRKLDKSIPLGNLDHEGNKIGPHCDDLTETIAAAIAKATGQR